VPPEPVPNVAFWIDGPDGIPIADVKNHAPERTLADARLIVAAPQLLAACRDLVDMADSLTGNWENGRALAVAVQNLVRHTKAASAVIIKATGETA